MNKSHLKLVSEKIKSWSKRNVYFKDIIECNYTKIDLVNHQFIGIPNKLSWYYDFIENKLDSNISERLVPGLKQWKVSSELYKNYQVHFKNFSYLYRYDLVYKTHDGYEYISFASTSPFSIKNYNILTFAFHELSHQMHSEVLNHYDLGIELKNYDLIKKNHATNNNKIIQNKEKIKTNQRYGDISLSRFEEEVISKLMQLMTVDEIAKECLYTNYQIENILSDIKVKFGDPNMSKSLLFSKLKSHDVLMTKLNEIM